MGYSDTSIGFIGGQTADTINYQAQNATNPWQKLSRTVYPKTVRAMHAWAAELWLHNGTYSEAISRAVRYFLTDIEVSQAPGDDADLSYKDKETYRETLMSDLDLMRIGEQAATEYVAFGLSLNSVYFPFDRNMRCDNCQFHTSLDALRDETPKAGKSAVAVKYSLTEKFHGVCPSCGKNVTYTVDDSIRKSDDQKPYVIRWPLKHSALKRNPISGRMFLRVRMSDWRFLAQPVKAGDMDIIAELPMDMLEAMEAGKALEIDQDEFYALRFPAHTDLDIELNGFGVPAFMSDFELSFMLVVMFKYMEAMSIDMVSPWRVITPKLVGRTSNTMEPLMNINMGDFMAEVRNMIGAYRQNPTLISTLAYPLEETQIGGDVQKLIPVQWYEYCTKQLLNNMGVPHEFTQHSLSGNAAPMIGYALFERDWQHLTDSLNGFYTWLGRKIGEQRGWKEFKVALVKSSVHNDPETRQVKMQMAASGQLSWSTAFRAYNLNYKEERRRVVEEAQWETEMQEEIAKLVEGKELNKTFLRTPGAAENLLLMQQMQQGGGMDPSGMIPTGAMPQQQGMAPPVSAATNTLEGVMAQAEQIASQLMGSDHATRRRMLSEIKATTPQLYATVKMLLEEYEQQASTQGVQMAREEAAAVNQQTV